MESDCRQKEVLAELAQIAGDAPFLALGQTVFWDEPMKAGVARRASELGFPRPLVAGVHDTDYFAKLPGLAEDARGGYKAFPHNDTTTRELWSAAAEFSSIFGSETVVTRDFLQGHGAKLAKVSRERPNFLNSITEAFGWRGVVSLSHRQSITSETKLSGLFEELFKTFEHSVRETVSVASGTTLAPAEESARQLLDKTCDASQQSAKLSLADFYTSLLPDLQESLAHAESPVSITKTTELLNFNSQTCMLPRFEIVDEFIRDRLRACEAYNSVVTGTEVYPLTRFGSWAIPFELVIPGQGRGTIRIAPKAIVIMTPVPQFITLKKPISSIEELAVAVERKFGTECTLIGKAVTLIGMLAREFVFVFHEGASSYVKHSRRLHNALQANGWAGQVNPILRVKYHTWDALSCTNLWFKLPAPLARAFGTEELCAPSFAARWREVAVAQNEFLVRLRTMASPLEFIRFLREREAGSWIVLEEQYKSAQTELHALHDSIEKCQDDRATIWKQIKTLKAKRNEMEHAKGSHWRERIFEKTPSPADLAKREDFVHEIESVADQIKRKLAHWKAVLQEQENRVADPSIIEAHATYGNIEVEAELKRLSMIRDAVIATTGLEKAGKRPSAWWFSVLSPNGDWFRRTMETAEYYLEPLQ